MARAMLSLLVLSGLVQCSNASLAPARAWSELARGVSRLSGGSSCVSSSLHARLSVESVRWMEQLCLRLARTRTAAH